MSGCMATDKPLVSIVMAVYEPNMDWLREQLESLNVQTYPNLELIVCDDYSPHVEFSAIQSCVRDCISAFPYTIDRNEENLGSNKTFERLTVMAKGEYIAYCDQDDVWLPEKLTVLQDEMARAHALLACADMYIMDGNGNMTADSIVKVRRHHVFKSGNGLASDMLFHNFASGCAMLVNAVMARGAIPFCPYMIHDHYIALCCAEHGRIMYVDKPLICYRLHGANQTGVMNGVHDKKSYGEVRIDESLRKIYWLKAHFACSKDTHKALDDSIIWLKARQSNWAHKGGASVVWKYRHFSLLPSVAEIVAKYMPNRLFMMTIRLARENKV